MTWIDLDPDVVRGFVETGVPTVVDRLDFEFGIRSWMRPAIKPLARTRIAGRAVTVMIAPASGPMGPLDQFFAAVDACGPGRILVITNGEDTTISCMGDLVATALNARGAEGAVMDGAVRDIDPMLEMGLPVFAASVSPVNFTGKVTIIGHDIPIVCGGVPVRPGDVVLADWDGVVVIPQEIAAEVLDKARVVEASERAMRERIREVGASRPIAEIFAEFE